MRSILTGVARLTNGLLVLLQATKGAIRSCVRAIPLKSIATPLTS